MHGHWQLQEAKQRFSELRGGGMAGLPARVCRGAVLFRDFANPQVVQDVLGGPGPEADAARNTS